jgi:osmotically-inducible protein OsmY
MDSFTTSRPDVDIEEEVARLIRSYPPLQMSRPYFSYQSVNGVLHLHGNVRTPQARRVLVDNAGKIPGVMQVEQTDLHDDEALRIAIGQFLPAGIFATVHGGVVSLTGRKLEQADAQALIDKVQTTAGVRRVGVALGESNTPEL